VHVESFFFIFFVDFVVLLQQAPLPFVSVLASVLVLTLLFSLFVVERRFLFGVVVTGTSSTGGNPQALQKCQSEYKVSGDTTVSDIAGDVATS